jgi:hypothetical protein
VISGISSLRDNCYLIYGLWYQPRQPGFGRYHVRHEQDKHMSSFLANYNKNLHPLHQFPAQRYHGILTIDTNAFFNCLCYCGFWCFELLSGFEEQCEGQQDSSGLMWIKKVKLSTNLETQYNNEFVVYSLYIRDATKYVSNVVLVSMNLNYDRLAVWYSEDALLSINYPLTGIENIIYIHTNSNHRRSALYWMDSTVVNLRQAEYEN